MRDRTSFSRPYCRDGEYGREYGRAADVQVRPGAVQFTVLSDDGTAYIVSQTVLSDDNTPYIVPKTVLSDDGTAYVVI